VEDTLRELDAAGKPTLVVFNKMDRYEAERFDPYLPEAERNALLETLERTWDKRTNGRAVFVAAAEKRNLEGLRARLLALVREAYAERYPYRTREWS
jgi:GTP-binding protein HflX